MLSPEEARRYGFPLDPLKFRECTDRVPEEARADRASRFYESRYYFVIVTEIITANDVEMTWLSIRRNDRKATQDWRHLQAIKNELTSPEREAVQLYPAESRLLDESNQIHLWVYPEDQALPFGYANRSVITATELERQYEAIQERFPGKMPGKPAQRPFDQATERASRSHEEMVADLNNSVVSRTFHRRREVR